MKKLTVLFTLATASLVGGCKSAGIISVFATPSRHEIKIPAEYDLTKHKHKDKKILLLARQPGWLNANVNLRYYLTKSINKEFTEKVKIAADNLVSYKQLSEFRSNKSDFSLLSPARVGKALGADMVLLVTVKSYQLNRMAETNYYDGFLNIQAVLIDVETEEKLWPESANSKSIKVGFEVESNGREVALDRLADACAHCTVRYLYNCTKDKFKIGDDRSGINLED